MKHNENNDEQIIILTKEEVNIIAAALNNRMIYLTKIEGKDSKWAIIEWRKCLELQCEWFEIAKY